jgi:Zn/Cd-binding protein ZinT
MQNVQGKDQIHKDLKRLKNNNYFKNYQVHNFHRELRTAKGVWHYMYPFSGTAYTGEASLLRAD